MFVFEMPNNACVFGPVEIWRNVGYFLRDGAAHYQVNDGAAFVLVPVTAWCSLSSLILQNMF